MARLIATLGLAAAASALPKQLILTYSTTTPLNTVDPRFINFNIDTGSIFNGLGGSICRITRYFRRDMNCRPVCMTARLL